jgi:hypothetical protein
MGLVSYGFAVRTLSKNGFVLTMQEICYPFRLIQSVGRCRISFRNSSKLIVRFRVCNDPEDFASDRSSDFQMVL